MGESLAFKFIGGWKDRPENTAEKVADHDAEEDGGGGQDTFGKVLQQDDGDEDHSADKKIDGMTEVLVIVSAAEGIDADADERETDGGHDGTGDHGGEKFPERFQTEAEDRLKQSPDKTGSQDGAVGDRAAAHGGDDAVHDADKAGAGAHDNGKAAADRAYGPELDQCHKTCDQHGVLDGRDHQPQIPESAGASDHEDRCEVSHEHRQHVLHTEDDGFPKRDPSLQLIFRGVLDACFFTVCHYYFLLTRSPGKYFDTLPQYCNRFLRGTRQERQKEIAGI